MRFFKQAILRCFFGFSEFQIEESVCSGRSVCVEDGKGRSAIDHLSRVIQSIDKISVGPGWRQKGAFVSAGGEKFFDLPASPLLGRSPLIFGRTLLTE